MTLVVGVCEGAFFHCSGAMDSVNPEARSVTESVLCYVPVSR